MTNREGPEGPDPNIALDDSAKGNNTSQTSKLPEGGSDKIRVELTSSGAIITSGEKKVILDKDDYATVLTGEIPPGLVPWIQDNGIDPDTLIRAVAIMKCRFVISEELHLAGVVVNGQPGYISYVRQRMDSDGNPREDVETIFVFAGLLEPTDIDGVPFFTVTLGYDTEPAQLTTLPETVDSLRKLFHLTPSKSQKLTEILTGWYQHLRTHELIRKIAGSPISVKDGIIKQSYDVSKMNVENILRKIRKFMPMATAPDHLRDTMAWALMAPLHYDLKVRAPRLIQAPNVFKDGKTKGGKTSEADLVVGHGYARDRDDYFLPYNRVATLYSLTWNLSLSNLPVVIDEAPADWFTIHANNFKSYCETGHFADRGKGQPGVHVYRGKASFITTSNEEVPADASLALTLRNLIQRYEPMTSTRRNPTEWAALYEALPRGFMFALFDAIFGGVSFQQVMNDVLKFQTPTDWLNYVIRKLNTLCDRFGIPQFEISKPKSINRDGGDNALEIAQAFIAEWHRIQSGNNSYNDRDGVVIQKQRYNSYIAGEFQVKELETRTFIDFTPGAFKALVARQHLNMPYKTASNFISNISPDSLVRVENDGKLHTVRIEDQTPKAFTISLEVSE